MGKMGNHVDIKACNCFGSSIHSANGFGRDLSLVWFSLETRPDKMKEKVHV